jgi:1,4-dihydroxy-2-naphthoate polyprenyltransferase
MTTWRIWFDAARPRTLPAAIAPVLVGSALAAREGRFEPAAAALCLGFALLAQIGANFANDYYDFVNGADNAARVGPRRAVAAGLVAPAVMRLATVLVLAAAFAVGLGLVAYGGVWMLAIGAASIACAAAYTGGPLPLGYLGFGDLLVFFFFGMVAVPTTYFVQAGKVAPEVFVAAVPIGLLAANILLVNNYRDAETDAAAGKRTLVVRWGRGFARVQFAASWAIALAVPAAFVLRGYPAWRLLPLLLAFAAWRQTHRLRTSTTPAQLTILLGDTGKTLAVYAALFAIGILI